MDLGKHLQSLSKRFHQNMESLDNKVLLALQTAGEHAVRIARSTKTYKDNTGNLSASIGYGIYYYGKNISTGGFGSGVGGQVGEKRLAEVASSHTDKPYVLIVVAGMHYALYVERSGYVVLDYADLQLDSIIREETNKINVFV